MTASAAHSILPPLSPEEERHCAAAVALIRERIRGAGGWISFATFMQLALYAPGLGYYSAGARKLGPGGDFVTAPEVSDLFSRCLARQCAQVLLQTGGEMLEIGAGTGRMAAIVLESLAQLDALPTRYAILEVSADLRERQAARLNLLPTFLRERVVWLDALPASPLRGVVVANEVLDALPTQRVIVRDGHARELGVVIADQGFGWSEHHEVAAAADALLRELPHALPDGYVSEICLQTEPWIASIGQCLERGVLLLLDYGLPRLHYYHPQRVAGTLRCHYKHLAHDDPFINVAVQDITSWVDFTRVAEAAVAVDLEVRGFVTQAAFLLGTGIEALVAAATEPVEHARLAGEARRLLLPGEMGEAFKVMALTRCWCDAMVGFTHQDLRPSL